MHDTAESALADVIAEVLATNFGADAAENAAESACDHDEDHLDSSFGHNAQIGNAAVLQAEDAVVHDLCHHPRLTEIDIDLKHHK